ncbi:MAG: ABC transporter permease [Gemmatimonadaceae bacterium]
MESLLGAFLDSAVRTGTPLALAALGETLAERTGVINLGTEGSIVAGAFGAAVAASTYSAPVGLLVGLSCGMLAAAVFACFAIMLRTDQIITGTAVTIGSLGITSALHRSVFGAQDLALRVPTLDALSIPVLARAPLLGAAFFRQPLPTYLAYAVAVVGTWMLFRTRTGLWWRATGESPEAVRAVGASPMRIQVTATLCGGALAGVAGATLVLAQVGTFADGMSAGRGFIAIAIVALGRWHPMGVLAAALLFGGSSALQYLFQATGSVLPYQVFLAIPYLLALAVLAAGAGRRNAPANLARPLELNP